MHRGCQRWRPLWFADRIVTQRDAVPKPAIGICQPSEQMSAQHSPDHSAPQSGRIFRDFHWGGIRSAVCKIWKRGVHVRTCRCTPPLTCAKSNSQLVYKHIKFERNRANRHGVIDGRVSPTPSNSARVTCRGRNRCIGVGVGEGGYRCRSNTKYIEW